MVRTAGRAAVNTPTELDRKEYCKRGHAFSVENSYYFKGKRSCRACRILWPVEARRRYREECLAKGAPLRTTAIRTIEEMRRIAKEHSRCHLSFFQRLTEQRYECKAFKSRDELRLMLLSIYSEFNDNGRAAALIYCWQTIADVRDEAKDHNVMRYQPCFVVGASS